MKNGRDRQDNNHYIEQTRRKGGYKSHATDTDITITDADKLRTIWAYAGATTTVIVTLPLCANNLDRTIDVMQASTGGGTVTLNGVNGTTTGLINGANTVSWTTSYAKRTVKTDGSNWFIMVAS